MGGKGEEMGEGCVDGKVGAGEEGDFLFLFRLVARTRRVLLLDPGNPLYRSTQGHRTWDRAPLRGRASYETHVYLQPLSGDFFYCEDRAGTGARDRAAPTTTVSRKRYTGSHRGRRPTSAPARPACSPPSPPAGGALTKYATSRLRRWPRVTDHGRPGQRATPSGPHPRGPAPS